MSKRLTLNTLFLSIAVLSFGCTNSIANDDLLNDQPIMVENQLPDPLEAGWAGEKVCSVVKENNKLRVLKCVFAPGVGHEKHYHKPHVGYTIAGGKFRLIDSKGTREVNVPIGSSFGSEQVTIHEVMNVGDTTAEFLIIEYK